MKEIYIYILRSKQKMELITMNIDSKMTRHIAISIIESRIKEGKCSSTRRNMSSVNTKTNSKFLGKVLTKNVIRLQYNIERKRKKEINITDKNI